MMSQNGVALLMSHLDNTTANLLSPVPVSILPLSVLIESLCSLEHVKNTASFSSTVRAALTDVLCILVGCTFLLAWRAFTPPVNGSANHVSIETLNQEGNGSDVTDHPKVTCATAEHATSISESVTSINDLTQDAERCNDCQESSPKLSRSDEEVKIKDVKAEKKALVERDAKQESLTQHNPASKEKLAALPQQLERDVKKESLTKHNPASKGKLAALPRQLERDVYTKVEDAVMIFEQKQRNSDLSLFNNGTEIASNMECPAVKFMMEEDGWWRKMPPAGFGLEIDRGVKGKLRCSCHGNALRVAIATGQPRFVSYILGTGYYDVNKSDRLGRSALFDAASLGSAEIGEIVIRYGAEVNRGKGATTWLNNPFYEACVRGHNRVVGLLLQHKVYVHEFPDSLLVACRQRNPGVVAALLRWRRQGSQYHRVALPLKGCMKAVTSEGNICNFLGRVYENIMMTNPGWSDYKRAVVILELLIEAGVPHRQECDCGRSDWIRGVHSILLWNKGRERVERERQATESVEEHLDKSYEAEDTERADAGNENSRDKGKCNCEYCIHRTNRWEAHEADKWGKFTSGGKGNNKDITGDEETEALAVIEEGFRSKTTIHHGEDHRGRKPKDQDEYSLYRTSDGLYQDSRGWCWGSENQYLQSEPWHPTWRTLRPVESSETHLVVNRG
jgi:hypothetical protein